MFRPLTGMAVSKRKSWHDLKPEQISVLEAKESPALRAALEEMILDVLADDKTAIRKFIQLYGSVIAQTCSRFRRYTSDAPFDWAIRLYEPDDLPTIAFTFLTTGVRAGFYFRTRGHNQNASVPPLKKWLEGSGPTLARFVSNCVRRFMLDLLKSKPTEQNDEASLSELDQIANTQDEPEIGALDLEFNAQEHSERAEFSLHQAKPDEILRLRLICAELERRLTARQLEIFGDLCLRKCSLKDAAAKYGVSVPRVSQIMQEIEKIARDIMNSMIEEDVP